MIILYHCKLEFEIMTICLETDMSGSVTNLTALCTGNMKTAMRLFSACYYIYAYAKGLDELICLSLPESYCLPILPYASSTVSYAAQHEYEMNECMNSVEESYLVSIAGNL